MTMKHPPFFVIGTQRGGTTLLRLMLNMHTKLVIPPESHFLLPLLENFNIDEKLDNNLSLNKALSIIQNHPRWSTWKISQQELNKLKKNVSFPLQLSTLIENVFLIHTEGKEEIRWGDKTPEYIDIIPQLIKLFPTASFVVLTRDGRDVSLSLKNRGWQGWSVWQRAKYWKESVIKMHLLKDSNKAIFVKYENLVSETENELYKICEFLGVDYEYEMLNFDLKSDTNLTEKEKELGIHKKLFRKPRKSDINRWKRQSKKSEVWAFEAIAYRELLMANYDITYFNTKNPLHVLIKIFYIIYGYLISILNYSFQKLIPSKTKDRVKQTATYYKIKDLVKSI